MTETENMSGEQRTLDGQPGSLPDIRSNMDSVTFVMVPPELPRGDELVIRCDADGDVWISIRRDASCSE
jgi:hypothetical protein